MGKTADLWPKPFDFDDVWSPAWVTRPEPLKGAKDEVKQARRAANWKSSPTSSFIYHKISELLSPVDSGDGTPAARSYRASSRLPPPALGLHSLVHYVM